MQNFDYSKLLGRIKEKGYTQLELAKAIHLSASTLSVILSGGGYFRQNIIERMCAVLDIDRKDIGAYFFTIKVQKN